MKKQHVNTLKTVTHTHGIYTIELVESEGIADIFIGKEYMGHFEQKWKGVEESEGSFWYIKKNLGIPMDELNGIHTALVNL